MLRNQILSNTQNIGINHIFLLLYLFDLILNVPSTIFHLNRDGSSWVEPVLSWDKCVLLKDHNAVTPVRLEPAAPRSGVKHSTTEPLRSHIFVTFIISFYYLSNIFICDFIFLLIVFHFPLCIAVRQPYEVAPSRVISQRKGGTRQFDACVLTM